VIQNEHQYKVTQNQLKDSEQALAELFQIKNNLHPRQFSSRKNGLQIAIDSLREEIEEYDALKQQHRLRLHQFKNYQ
jgi:HTH-type transcriptional regulator / antitoxin HipB